MAKTQHYLFDWGDTLMVDLPNQTGPMCDWPTVQVVGDAKACLERLSKIAECHLATNSEDSSETQIRTALERAGLSEYITRIFCRGNLGMDKTDAGYYPAIADSLNISPKSITMIGDSLERDVHKALKAGLKAVWFNPNNNYAEPNILCVSQLNSLS